MAFYVYLSAVLGSQGIVVKWIAAIFFRMVVTLLKDSKNMAYLNRGSKRTLYYLTVNFTVA